jgi:S1-C subfamily serine protease
MNLIDFSILTILFVFLAYYKQRLSLVYYLCSTLCALSGFILAFSLAPIAVINMSSDLQKGIIEIVLVIGLSGVFYFLGARIGNKFRIKVIESRFYRADRWLCIPYKVLAVVLLVVLLTQTLIYVPILSIQYLAQGSSMLYFTDKHMPELFIRHQAKKVSPNQFRNLTLDYDRTPLTYNNINKAGKFQKVVDTVAPSVVKVSGRSCLGLGFGSGFVVAPNLVVTNEHVITGASTIYISDHNGAYPATPLLMDAGRDIAILYSKFINNPAIPLSNKPATLGEENIVLGYPAGGDLKFSLGMVNNNLPNFSSTTTKLIAGDILTLTAQVIGGNSGGPVLNQAGEVIGVVSASDGKNAITIKSGIVIELVNKAKGKLFPARTSFCEVGSKHY